MNPKLKKILDMTEEDAEALSPDEFLAHVEEMYQLAARHKPAYPPQLLAQIKQVHDEYGQSLSDQREAERRLEIATQNRAIMQAKFDRKADLFLQNLPDPKNIH